MKKLGKSAWKSMPRCEGVYAITEEVQDVAPSDQSNLVQTPFSGSPVRGVLGVGYQEAEHDLEFANRGSIQILRNI